MIANLSRSKKMYRGQNIMRSLCKQRVVIAMGITCELARVTNDRRLCYRLSILEEIPLKKHVEADYRRTSVD